MANLGDLIRDSALAKAMFGARYGTEEDPYVIASREAQGLGYAIPGATNDVGEAQRYVSSNLAAKRYGLLPLITNPLHEAVLSWVSEGEGKPSVARLLAGYRGALDALENSQNAPQEPVRPGFGLKGAQIQSAEPSKLGTIGSLIASMIPERILIKR